jgi:hypothetical protein
MHLIRLIYASRVSTSLLAGEVEDIIESSKLNNKIENITGVLVHNNDYFLQCLEGSRVSVNSLYHKILKDKRHLEPAILKYDEIIKRDFGRWNMAFIPSPVISGELILNYSGSKKFNPFSMSGESCYELLRELARLGIAKP